MILSREYELLSTSGRGPSEQIKQTNKQKTSQLARSPTEIHVHFLIQSDNPRKSDKDSD